MSKAQLLLKHRKGKWVQRYYDFLKERSERAILEDDVVYLTQHHALGLRIRADAVACGCGPRMLANIDLMLAIIGQKRTEYQEVLK